jgi:hypothetical protein
LTYRWLKNSTNLLSDGVKFSGSSSSSLMISGVLGADAAAYSLVVSNSFGSITTAPPAVLSVIDPVIMTQPASRVNHAGTDAQFHVGVIGTDPAYQWLRQDTGLLPLATQSFLQLPFVTSAAAATYQVIVSNIFGTVTSAPASLTVVGPLSVETMLVSNTTALIQFPSIPGSNYTVQYKDNLTSAAWSNLSTITATAPITTVTNDVVSLPQRFYRILLQ